MSKTTAYLRKWDGGRVRLDAKGREVWVLRQQYNGVSYSFTLQVNSEEEAKAELALFRRGPTKYRTKKMEDKAAQVEDRDRVVLNLDRSVRYLRYLREECECTERYINEKRLHLVWWMERLADRDLRTVTTKEIVDILDSKPVNWRGPLITIKGFYTYLTKRAHAMSSKENPTIDIAVPQARPARLRKDKGYTAQQLERLYRHLGRQDMRDIVLVKAKTGMHMSEIERIVKGQAVITTVTDHGEIAGTVAFMHKKKGQRHILSVDAQTLAALQRLVAGGMPTYEWCNTLLSRASQDLGVEPAFKLGEFRHSFVTIARQLGRMVKPVEGLGLSLEDIAETTGHSPKTADRFYDGTKIKAMIAMPFRFAHPEDPVTLAAATHAG